MVPNTSQSLQHCLVSPGPQAQWDGAQWDEATQRLQASQGKVLGTETGTVQTYFGCCAQGSLLRRESGDPLRC